MRPEDFEKKVFSDFKGIYDRGNDDIVPEKYWIDGLNVDFEIGECRTRAGLTPAIPLGYGGGDGKVRRTANFNHPNGVITLILDDAGNLYTFSNRLGDGATTPRMTVTDAKDFSALQMLGKIFISFHNGKTGLTGESLKVFIPAVLAANDEFRNAAGVAPTAVSPMIAVDGTPGSVLAGNYLIAVAFQTTSGHYTVPGPLIASIFSPTFYVAPGGLKINLSNIPVGPAGTAKRQILITEPNLTEYFFLPEEFGGVINDNTTTVAALNFNSITDLQDSADYLFDLLPAIPAGVGLQDFNGRLAVWGEAADTSIVRFSNIGEPEAFDAVDNIVIVNKDSGAPLRNGLVIRNVFYACTEKGVHGVVDNEDIPSNWKPIAIDQNVDVPSHGVASFFSQSGVKFVRDWSLIVDRSGILYMDGSIKKPPITDAINDIWQRINFQFYHRIQLVVDERRHKVYCSLPLDTSEEINTILMGDYNVCSGKVPNVDGIKWVIWTLHPAAVTRGATDISMTTVSPEVSPTLKVGSVSGGGKIWRFDESNAGKDDSDTYNVVSYIQTAQLFWIPGYIHTFAGVSIRISGEGIVLPVVKGLDDQFPVELANFQLEPLTGKTKLIKCNFQHEKATFIIAVRYGKFIVGDMIVYGKPTFPMRPA